MKSDPLLPDGGRREFVKRSLAASIVAAQPTILAGLLRAEGGGGGGTTVDPWETTVPETTDPWETTVPETTVPDTTVPPPTGMLCTNPPEFVQTKSKDFVIGVAIPETIRVVVSSATRKKDSPGTTPYQDDVPSWVISIDVYEGTTLLASETQTRNFSFEYNGGTISSEEPSPPPATPGGAAAGEWGLSVPFLDNFVTSGGQQFSVSMESQIGGGGGKDLTLYQIVRVEFTEGGNLVEDRFDDDNIKNLEYDPA